MHNHKSTEKALNADHDGFHQKSQHYCKRLNLSYFQWLTDAFLRTWFGFEQCHFSEQKQFTISFGCSPGSLFHTNKSVPFQYFSKESHQCRIRMQGHRLSLPHARLVCCLQACSHPGCQTSAVCLLPVYVLWNSCPLRERPDPPVTRQSRMTSEASECPVVGICH